MTQMASDEEIEDFCFGICDFEGQCMHCSGNPHDETCPIITWKKIKARIDFLINENAILKSGYLGAMIDNLRTEIKELKKKVSE